MENSLIPAFAHIGHGEKRFLAYCIAQLDAKRETAIGRIRFRATDYAKIFQLPLSNVYDEIREKSSALNFQPFRRYEDGKHKTDAWIYWSEYKEFEGEIEVQLNERLTPLLLDLKDKQYIQFALHKAKDFTNKGWSLYVILKQWVKKGSQEFELEDLKFLMGISGKYKKWYEFSRQVIIPATENINKVSDLTIEHSTIKRGRRVIGLYFSITRKKAGDEDVIDIQPQREKLYLALLNAGLSPKTAKNYSLKAEEHNKTKIILDKLPGMIKRASKQPPQNQKKYLQGAISHEISQGSIFNISTKKQDTPTAGDIYQTVTPQNGEYWQYEVLEDGSAKVKYGQGYALSAYDLQQWLQKGYLHKVR